MLRFYILIGVALVSLGIHAPAQAQAAANCAAEVKKLQNTPEMRVQGGVKNQAVARQNAIVYLQSAAQAAKAHDDKLCWQKLKDAQVALFN
jgi:hypothetical protein